MALKVFMRDSLMKSAPRDSKARCKTAVRTTPKPSAPLLLAASQVKSVAHINGKQACAPPTPPSTGQPASISHGRVASTHLRARRHPRLGKSPYGASVAFRPSVIRQCLHMDSPDDLPSAPAEAGAGMRRAGSAPERPAFGFKWIPIRSLAPRHRPHILKHLLALRERDRYLRFGHIATDTQIGRYVELLNFERDEIFGVFNRRLELVAMAHLAYLDASASGVPCAEFGVSVAGHLRGRGCGERLFDHAALHARNRGIDTLLVHALSENTAMLRIARNAGARIERDGPESQALVKLAPESMASRVEALVEDRAADLDYSLKQQAKRVDGFLAGLTKSPHN
ncbi:MAG: GNAT family N-acetyltransferase [Rubrivivax sp.]